MRSRLARACTRVSVFVVMMIVGTATAGAATLEQHAQAQAAVLESLRAPVGLAAVGLGVTGMLAGAFRRKRATVQPENERKF